MAISDKDLEGLLAEMPKIQSMQPITDESLALAIRTSARKYNERAGTDLRNFYSDVAFARETFVNAHQIGTLINGQFSGDPRTHDYTRVWKSIDEVFGTGFSKPGYMNIGDHGSVYLFLKHEEGNGKLACYGLSHRERRGPNPHYFEVRGDYEKLKLVFESIITDPNKLKDFIEVALKWKSIPVADFINNGRGQPNLVEDMKKLITYSQETGYRVISV